MKTLVSTILALGMAAPTQFIHPQEVVIRATGIGHLPPHVPSSQGRLLAQRAAETDALRRLSEALQVPLVRSIPGPNGQVRTTTETTLSGYQFLPPRGLPDGSIEVTVELPVSAIRSNERALLERMNVLENELQQSQQQLAHFRARIAELEQWIGRHLDEQRRSLESGNQILNRR